MTIDADGEMSTFALDVYWAAGRPADAALEAHVAGCGRCRAYLAELDRLAEDRRAPAAARRRGWALPSAVVTAVALAAAAVLFVRGRAAPPAEYVGAKGAPAVQVLVHRDAETWIWDARSPVRPGDALALRVACEGLEHVAVASPGAGGWERITDAACPAGSEPLPFTLVVDGAPGDEELAVVLSREVLDDETLRAAVTEGRRTQDVWVTGFVLPKEGGSGR